MENKTRTFAQLQRDLAVPKANINQFGKYKYRSCEDILAALRPILGEWKLTLHDEIVLIGERYYVKATANCSLGTEVHSTSAFAREPEEKKGMSAEQNTGSASSYARKYALNGLFCIDDTEDADTQDNTKKEPAKKIETQDNQKRLDLIEKIRELIGDRVQSMEPQEKGKFLFSLGGIKSPNDLMTKKLSDLEAILIKLEIPW